MYEFYILIVVLFLTSGWYFYKWATRNRNYFADLNIPYLNPTFLLGDTGTMLFTKGCELDWIQNIYYKLPEARLIGIFDFTQPLFFVRDPALAKKLMIKEFDSFTDHKSINDLFEGSLLASSLVSLTGERWRAMRTTLSPAFTGSKMRLMFELVNACSQQFTGYYEKVADERKSVDIKDSFSRFTNDVIATCAFGIKVDSLENKENDYYKMGKQLMNFSTVLAIIKFTVISILPFVAKKFNITIMSAKLTNFFRSLILDTIVVRERNNIIRPDMINQLMQLRQNKTSPQTILNDNNSIPSESFAAASEIHLSDVDPLMEWTDDDLVAQCLVFLFAGFETTSTLLVFVAYELATNSDIQTKLRTEIDEVAEQLSGKQITYDVLQSMQYLDMVISETLRKWPPAFVTDRTCTREHTLKDGDLEIKFEKGANVWFPIYAFQNDPQYFPEPSKFDPERFSPANKNNINLNTYLPFGAGPRNCIGSRFALMEAKCLIYNILCKFEFEVCEDTLIPLKFVVGQVSMKPIKPIKLRLKLRHQ